MGEGGPKTEMLDVSKLAGDGPEVTLVVAIAGGPTKRYPMRAATMTIGRSDQSDIAIKEPSVSSKHGEFSKSGASVLFRDVGSSNGSFVGADRIQEVELQNGDTVRLGNVATVTVESGGPARPKAPPPAAPDNENPGSTAMISADALDAMRRGEAAAPPARKAAPPPPPRPRPAPPPMPMPMPAPVEEESGGSKLPLIIGIVVAVLLLGGVGGFFAMKSSAHKKAVQAAAAVEAQALALLDAKANPCASAEEKVQEIVKAGADLTAPTGKYRPIDRPKNFRWVSAQRSRAEDATRLGGGLPIEPIRQAVAAAKATANGIEDEAIKTKALEVASALEARAQAAEDFVAGLKKVGKELENYADLGEKAYVFGNPEQVADFGSFTLSKEPAAVLKACKNAHDLNKTDVEEKIAALKAAAAQ